MIKKVYAHRGSSGTHPENTLAAINDAIVAGVDGIEIDVQKTKDGKLVVIHDEAIDRTTSGKGLVKDLTLAKIQSYDAGEWFAPEFKGERIPVLEDVLEALQGTSVHLNIELKNNIINYPEIEADVYKALINYDMLEQTLISSFNHKSLATLAKKFPKADLAVLTEEVLENPAALLAGLRTVSIHCPLEIYHQMINTKEGKAFNYRIYTVNDENDLLSWQDQSNFDIFTDYPRDFMRIILRCQAP